ncbi:hypothetical protein B0H17DRAFT_1202814 [Mycena rosella]|uniref:Uncharacterized protein n=1 Tax=Mycena rosella TaxID=1033263 RepID=A0AAD7GH59_MYCRO|nr:hypothetical protein B0H17DRAFT_1202814 [Mycena rosella]
MPSGRWRPAARALAPPALRRRIKSAAAPHDADTAAGHPASSIDARPTYVRVRRPHSSCSRRAWVDRAIAGARDGMRTPAMHRAPMPSGWCDSARSVLIRARSDGSRAPRPAPPHCYAATGRMRYAHPTSGAAGRTTGARRLRWQCADDGRGGFAGHRADDGPRAAQDAHPTLRTTHGARTGADTDGRRTARVFGVLLYTVRARRTGAGHGARRTTHDRLHADDGAGRGRRGEEVAARNAEEEALPADSETIWEGVL